MCVYTQYFTRRNISTSIIEYSLQFTTGGWSVKRVGEEKTRCFEINAWSDDNYNCFCHPNALRQSQLRGPQYPSIFSPECKALMLAWTMQIGPVLELCNSCCNCYPLNRAVYWNCKDAYDNVGSKQTSRVMWVSPSLWIQCEQPVGESE